ncbi:hypothetical protein C8Q76DRAFT_798141 [Earliella scabrosa]|nr:hypothetical protein C8Q76DRAFT_798141 [Earliella scabrosa]
MPSEQYDGVPIVETVGDDGEVFSGLLDCIYSLHLPRSDPNTPIILTPIVRMVSKYLVDSVRDNLVRRVVEDWPRTLEEWDRQEAIEPVVMGAPFKYDSRNALPQQAPHKRPVAQSFPEPASAIRFPSRV